MTPKRTGYLISNHFLTPWPLNQSEYPKFDIFDKSSIFHPLQSSSHPISRPPDIPQEGGARTRRGLRTHGAGACRPEGGDTFQENGIIPLNTDLFSKTKIAGEN